VIRISSKVNEFMVKNNEYGTTTSSKKNTIDLKGIFWLKNRRGRRINNLGR
jgi:hypothetical protein